MPPVNKYGSSARSRRNFRPMLSGIDPSSGGTVAREHRRAPPAIGNGLHVDDAAPAGRRVALLAARRLGRLLERHSALARHRHLASLPRPGSASGTVSVHSLCRRAVIKAMLLFL